MVAVNNRNPWLYLGVGGCSQLLDTTFKNDYFLVYNQKAAYLQTCASVHRRQEAQVSQATPILCMWLSCLLSNPLCPKSEISLVFDYIFHHRLKLLLGLETLWVIYSFCLIS